MIGNEATYVLARQNDIIKYESNFDPFVIFVFVVVSWYSNELLSLCCPLVIRSPTAAIGMQIDWQLINRVTVMRSRRSVTK